MSWKKSKKASETIAGGLRGTNSRLCQKAEEGGNCGPRWQRALAVLVKDFTLKDHTLAYDTKYR